jgi:hypothetical protein
MEKICRFCWQPATIDANPLISPCECRGSVQYVHLECMKRWRQITPYEDFVQRCQLCLTTIHMPTYYPLETIPDIQYDSAWAFLSRPYISVLLVYSLFMSLINNQMIARFQQLSLVLTTDDARFYLRWVSPVPSFGMPILTHDDFHSRANLYKLYVFMGMASIQAAYIFYYIHRLGNIKNRKLYMSYWTRFNVNNSYPLPYLCLLVLSYMSFVVSLEIDPYVYIYDMNSLSKETAWWIMFRLIMSDISCISHCLLLPKFAHIHTTILQNMNDAAQM